MELGIRLNDTSCYSCLGHVDAGDNDFGPNDLQNSPTVTNASTFVGSLTVSGRFNSRANQTYTLEIAMEVAQQFIIGSRDVLKNYIGRKPCGAFDEIGFKGSLAIPRSAEKLCSVLSGLSHHFTRNPQHENVVLELSAARADELLAATLAAKTDVNRQIVEVRRLMQDRDAKVKLVRKDLQTLMAELRVKVGLFGLAWEWFGLKAPGVMQQPEVPENVNAELKGKTATVQCDRAPRARRYRYWRKVIGVDEDFVLLASRRARDLCMWDLPPNVEMEIAVSASNNGGESLRSAIVKIKTPPLDDESNYDL